MPNNIGLLQSLLEQAESLTHRDHGALDALERRTEMVIHRIFGESSHYLQSFHRIYFLPQFAPSNNSDRDEAWSEAHRSIINLTRTMVEEIQVFESAPTPVLMIYDEELRQRTSDLLAASGRYDRVLREATTVLEARLRQKVPFDDLAKIIPNAADQMGDNLVNKLLSPNNPILVFGERHEQTRLFRILGGVMAYLRNPFHHSVDNNVEWS